MDFEKFAKKAIKTAGWIGADVASHFMKRAGEMAIQMESEYGKPDKTSEKSFEYSEKLKEMSYKLKGSLHDDDADDYDEDDDDEDDFYDEYD